MDEPSGDLHPWVVGIGANVGSTAAAFAIAQELIEAHVGRVSAVSAAYQTPPMGPAQPDYRNGAFRVESALPPLQLLERLMEIERTLGRDRMAETRWGPRTMDLDVLHGFSRSVALPKLTVPHPRLQGRAFALVPLLDVAPELREELGGALDALQDRALRLAPAPDVGRQHGATTVEASNPLDALALAVRAACARGGVTLPAGAGPTADTTRESQLTTPDGGANVCVVDVGSADELTRTTSGDARRLEALATGLEAALVNGPRIAGLHLAERSEAALRAAVFTSQEAARLSSLRLQPCRQGWRAVAEADPH